jgi:hypothetical protein
MDKIKLNKKIITCASCGHKQVLKQPQGIDVTEKYDINELIHCLKCKDNNWIIEED